MGKFDALINAARKAINSSQTLVENDETPFNVVYKSYKTLQSFWFRVVEDAAETNNSRLEDLCIDLEEAIQDCEDWIKRNSPNKPQTEESSDGETQQETKED